MGVTGENASLFKQDGRSRRRQHHSDFGCEGNAPWRRGSSRGSTSRRSLIVPERWTPALTNIRTRTSTRLHNITSQLHDLGCGLSGLLLSSSSRPIQTKDWSTKSSSSCEMTCGQRTRPFKLAPPLAYLAARYTERVTHVSIHTREDSGKWQKKNDSRS